METAATILETFEPKAMLSLNLADVARGWSKLCSRFLTWEREAILGGNPDEKMRKEHREVLKSLLRWTRFFQSMLADPDLLPERPLLDEIEGRLLQLESSWKMANNPMEDKEAGSLFREVFTSEADKQFANKLFPETSE